MRKIWPAGASTLEELLTAIDAQLQDALQDLRDLARGIYLDPARASHGTGLQGIADRLGALEGTLEVRSAPGQGTAVVGRIPVAPGRA